VLRDIFVNQLGFEELDQYQLTAAKLDTRDGIHYAGVHLLEPHVQIYVISSRTTMIEPNCILMQCD
jgi:hypothetical protein